VGPAVLLGSFADDQPSGLQLVEQADHARPFDAESAGDGDLCGAEIGRDGLQDRVADDVQIDGGQRRVDVAENPMLEAADEIAEMVLVWMSICD
jgi:hypothetical protein